MTNKLQTKQGRTKRESLKIGTASVRQVHRLVRPGRSLQGLKADVSVCHSVAGIRLQSNKAWGSGRTGQTTVGVGVCEHRYLRPIEKDCVRLPLDLNFKFVPITGRVSWLLCEGLTRLVVNGARALNRKTVWLSQFIDLHLEAEFDTHIRRVVVTFAVRVRKTNEDTRIVLAT